MLVGLGLWSQSTFGRAVRHAVAWVLVGGTIFFAHNHWTSIEWAARRMAAELTPPIATVQPAGVAVGDRFVVERMRGAQFRVPATINEAPVAMLVDTGASIVTLTHEDAIAAGMDMKRLNYSMTIYTANGKTTAAPVIIDRLALGPIERRRVPALVAHQGALERSLLGLSFLDTLSGYSISGDRLEFAP